MTPERFRQVRNLFEAALEREAPLRAAFLAEACQGDEPLRAEVGRLLSAHEKQAGLLDREAARPELLTGEAGKMEGRRIDHYEILRELGRGGMGSVYLATRTDNVYRKPVALKVVRPEAGSAEVIERFRREREILASLDHPNIARLLDGGSTPEGLPYFVMDYIEGRPIDTYCDERQLDIAERLELFRSVCAAVGYAHSRGVVHRDLKPRNIFVTAEGTVKLLDFGIAKLLRTEGEEPTAYLTRTGMQLMTPEYASPEQVRGEAVGTASDIYSLGVVLYELLTGHRPYRMKSRLIHEVIRVICEEEPTRPSTAVTQAEQRLTPGEEKPVVVTPEIVSQRRKATPAALRQQLSGDPDKILLKALRKDPALRYSSSEAFSDDIRRHLDRLPVLAKEENLAERSWRRLKPYKAWLVAAAVLAITVATGAVNIHLNWVELLLIAATAACLSTLYYRVIEKEGKDAAWRKHRIAFLLSVFFAAGFFAFLIRIRGFDPGLETAQHRARVPADALLVVLFSLIFALNLGTLLARWPLRGQWAGALLLDLPQPRKRSGVFAFVTITAISTLFLLSHIDTTTLVLYFWIWLSALTTMAFDGRAEFRERGFLMGYSFYSWPRVKWYAWEHSKDKSVFLRMGVWRWGRLDFRTVQLKMAADEKAAAQAILSRQLPEWPASPEGRESSPEADWDELGPDLQEKDLPYLFEGLRPDGLLYELDSDEEEPAPDGRENGGDPAP